MQQPEGDILALYIAVGEAKGGRWDMKRRRWSKAIPHPVVYAVLAEEKKQR